MSTWQHMFLQNLYIWGVVCIPHHVTNLLPVNHIHCEIFHQLFSVFISQLSKSFVATDNFFGTCCWHQIQNEHSIFKNNEMISQFRLVICCLCDVFH